MMQNFLIIVSLDAGVQTAPAQHPHGPAQHVAVAALSAGDIENIK